MQNDKIEYYKLQNGLHTLVRGIQGIEDCIIIELVVKVGSIVEAQDNSGIAHFLEHMLISFNECFDWCHYSAYTDYYLTKYKFITNKSRIFDCFKLIRDIIEGVYLDDAHIENVRQDILLEYDHNNKKEFFECLFSGTQLEGKAPIGRRENILSMTLDDLKRFYQQWYATDRMNLIMIGNENVFELYNKNIKLLAEVKKKNEIHTIIKDDQICKNDSTDQYFESTESFIKIDAFRYFNVEDIEAFLSHNYEFIIFVEVLNDIIEMYLNEKNIKFDEIEIEKYILSECTELHEINIKGIELNQYKIGDMLQELIYRCKTICLDVIESALVKLLSLVKDTAGYGINLNTILRECEEHIVFNIPLIDYDFAYQNADQVISRIEPINIFNKIQDCLDEAFVIYS